MHRYRPLLCVHACTQHGSRTEQHTDSAVVHALKHLLPRLFGLGGLDELYLIGRNTHRHQLVLDVLADIPLVRLVGGKVAEYELCATVGVRFHIILVDGLCAS